MHCVFTKYVINEINYNIITCILISTSVCVCSPTYEQNMTDEPGLVNRLVTDNSLARLSRGHLVDLWVYDDHFADAKSIKVGNFRCYYNVFDVYYI